MVDGILLYQASKKKSTYIHEYKFSLFFLMSIKISLWEKRVTTHGKYTRYTPKSQE